MMKRWLIFLLLAVVFLTYLNILPNRFLWDDEEQVLNNPYLKSLQFLPQFFSGSTFNTGGAGLSGWYYKPLLSLWFMINFRLWGLKATGFHFTQLLLHLANTWLVFLIFKKSINQKTAFWLSLFWAIHPANVESVVYISAAQEPLYTFFLLSGLWLFIRFPQKEAIFGASGLFFLGLLAKESAIVGLPTFFLYLLLVKKNPKFAFGWLLVSSLTLSIYLIMRLGIAHIPLAGRSPIIPIASAPLLIRLLTLPFELFSYLRLIFFPFVLTTAQHQLIRQPTDIRFWGSLVIIIPLLVILTIVLIKAKDKLANFFFLWWLIGFGLISNLIPLDMTMAERWLYWPILGLFGLLIKKIKNPTILSLIVILLAGRTLVRTFDWRDGLTLFSHDIKYAATSFDLQNNLGVELFRVGKIEEAKPHFEKSIELQPLWWTAYNNLGAVYQRKGDFEKAKQLYRLSITNGDYYLAYENLAVLIFNTEDRTKTIEFLNSALKKLPHNPKLQQLLILAKN